MWISHPTKNTIAHKETTSDPQNSVPKSLNWFEGNVTGKPYISWTKTLVSCRCSSQSIDKTNLAKVDIGSPILDTSSGFASHKLAALTRVGKHRLNKKISWQRSWWSQSLDETVEFWPQIPVINGTIMIYITLNRSNPIHVGVSSVWRTEGIMNHQRFVAIGHDTYNGDGKYGKDWHGLTCSLVCPRCSQWILLKHSHIFAPYNAPLNVLANILIFADHTHVLKNSTTPCKTITFLGSNPHVLLLQIN